MPAYVHEGRTLTIDELRDLFRTVSIPDSPAPNDLALLGVEVVVTEDDPPVDNVERLRAERLAELDGAFQKAACNAAVMSSLGFMIDADETAARNVQGLVTSMTARSATDTVFCDHSNTMRSVTLDNLRTIQLEIIEHGQALYARKWKIRQQLLSAKNERALNRVVIDFVLTPENAQ